MKLILDDKYLCSMDALRDIREVEAFGDWSARKYKVLGEPKRIAVVADSDVVEGEAAEQAVNEAAAVALRRVEAELAALKLSTAQRDAETRILAEKRGVSTEDVRAFCKAQTLVYAVSNATTDDVRKWMRAQRAE